MIDANNKSSSFDIENDRNIIKRNCKLISPEFIFILRLSSMAFGIWEEYLREMGTYRAHISTPE